MKASEFFEGLAYLIMAAIVLAFIGGWVANVVAIAKTVSDPITGIFVLRCLGVLVPPLGSILGFV